MIHGVLLLPRFLDSDEHGVSPFYDTPFLTIFLILSRKIKNIW